MKELLKVLKPLKIKIIIETYINCLIVGLAIGLTLSTSILIMSKFIFIDKILIKIIIALIIGLIFGLIMALTKIPTVNKIAETGDALGFKERFITAIEILSSDKKNDVVYKLAVDDAIVQAKNADFKKLYKINISNKKYIAVTLTLIITVVTGFMPSWKADEIKKQSQLQQTINEELKNIDEIYKQIEDLELKSQLKELEKELKKLKSETEAVKAIQKTQQQLKKIENKNIPKDLKELGDKLTQNKLTEQLGESLQNMSVSDIKKELEKSKDMLNDMQQEDLKAFAKEIDTLAAQLSQDNALKNDIEDLAESVSSTNLEQINSSLDNISQKTTQLAEQNKKTKETIKQINKTLNSSTKNLQSNNIQETTQQKNPQNQQGQPSNNNGNGEIGGNSRGEGSTPNKDIYTRELENADGSELQIQAEKNESGIIQEKDIRGQGDAGDIISYEKVYQEYKQEALKTLNEDNIPYGMKNLIEEYFSSLE